MQETITLLRCTFRKSNERKIESPHKNLDKVFFVLVECSRIELGRIEIFIEPKNRERNRRERKPTRKCLGRRNGSRKDRGEEEEEGDDEEREEEEEEKRNKNRNKQKRREIKEEEEGGEELEG